MPAASANELNALKNGSAIDTEDNGAESYRKKGIP